VIGQALFKLGQRMAARNNIFAFAWICATVLPVALQLIAGVQEEVRMYLDSYYGPFTLYFFFTMTYGFAAVFVSYYQISGYRKPASLDLLRVTRLRPVEVVAGIMLQLQAILLPPVVGFAIGFVIYMLWWPEFGGQIRGLGGQTILGATLGTLLNQVLLSGVVMLGLLRNEAAATLPAVLLVSILNLLPIAFLVWFDWPLWLYALLMLACCALLFWVAVIRLAELWPAQHTSRRMA
jgi:hypothetical protein